MKCPQCQAENLGDALFCEECSVALEATCPQCHSGNRPTAKFCRKCRADLTGAPGIAVAPWVTTLKRLNMLIEECAQGRRAY